MDELYDNLDNYNEEVNIAELQTENKALKSKMEEYSLALINLQKEFDKLSSEHKRLELNYSSLLKTAKAEIQRKTQIITALNLEKDSMILKSYQNKNAGNIHKARNSDIPKKARETNERTKSVEKLKHFEGRKHSIPSERKEQNDPFSRDTTDSPHGDVKSKLLELAHRGQNDSKHTDVKENVIKHKKDGDPLKGASIKDRRKSVPATSFEKEQTSEDELSSVGGSKIMQQMIREEKFSGKYNDRNFRHSPIFETSSSEEKRYGYLELDHHTQRSSRSDRNKDDRYRVRHKSSHRYKRQSPDRYHGGSKEYYDSHRKFEYDRHRAKRTVESPPRDYYYHHRSNREQHAYAYDKNHTYESSLPQSQERYSKKRKIEQVYEDFEDKKVRMEDSTQLAEDKKKDLDKKILTVESHSKHLEDHKFICGGKPSEQKYIADSEIQFSSCESPDYNYRDVSNQYVKEIQFDATTVLDDPRVSSSKYILKENDGEVVLRTMIGRNVDMVPVQKDAWEITPENTPKALLNRPEHTAENIKVENPVNVAIEFGEIPGLGGKENKPNQMNKLEISCERKAQLLPKIDDFKDMEKSLKSMNSYKIPKLRKSTEEMESNHFTESTIKPNHSNIRSIKNNENSAITMKDVIKQEVKPIKENKNAEGHQHSSLTIQSKNEPKCEVSPKSQQKYSDAKKVVEGDLEMSDDNCDDNEQSDFVMKQTYHKTDSENMAMNKEADKQSTHALGKVSPEPSKDKTPVSDSKKTKTKRKSRHRDTKETIRIEDLANIPEKSVKKKEKRMKSTQIKTKFSELFDDSSSLICPEDLGLPLVPAQTTLLPDKCNPIIEDTPDMDDLEKKKYLEKSNIESKPHSSIIDPKIDIAVPALLEKLNDKSDEVQTEITDDVIKSIYQNLEPEMPDEENVVKTVIISTGVQPPVILERDGEILPPENQEPKIKAVQDLGLQALATSTPHKIWQPDAVDIQPNPSASAENNINNGQTLSKDNSLTDKSDSNIIESQSNNTNAPDVRIVVKRRRKVIKNQS